MPIQRCSVKGQPGWRWGQSGKCYTYKAGDKADSNRAKKLAIKQAIAIGGGSMPEQFTEYTDSRGLEIAREPGVLKGVKILGLESRNGRRYTREAIRRAAEQYDGIRVNVDHGAPGKPRSYRDRIGTLTDIQTREDGLYGTLRYNPEHALAKQLEWDAEHQPQALGLSHDIEGKASRSANGMVVEEIRRVRSVDLVADPATTQSLFEASADDAQEDPKEEVVMNDLTLEKLRAERPDLVQAIEAQVTEPKDKELAALQEEVQKLKTAAELHERQAAVQTLLKEAGWPADAITEQRIAVAVKLSDDELKTFAEGLTFGSDKPKSKEQGESNEWEKMDAKAFAEAITA